MGWLLDTLCLINCTGDVTVVFFYSVLQISAGLICVGKLMVFLLDRTICRQYFV